MDPGCNVRDVDHRAILMRSVVRPCQPRLPANPKVHGEATTDSPYIVDVHRRRFSPRIIIEGIILFVVTILPEQKVNGAIPRVIAKAACIPVAPEVLVIDALR